MHDFQHLPEGDGKGSRRTSRSDCSIKSMRPSQKTVHFQLLQLLQLPVATPRMTCPVTPVVPPWMHPEKGARQRQSVYSPVSKTPQYIFTGLCNRNAIVATCSITKSHRMNAVSMLCPSCVLHAGVKSSLKTSRRVQDVVGAVF